MRQDDIDKRELPREAPPTSEEIREELVVGKGKVFINGRYIGNTSRAEIVRTPQGTQFVFRTENISDANLDMLMDWPAKVRMDYKALNPHGRRLNYRAEGGFLSANLNLKDDTWQGIVFTMYCDTFERALAKGPAND